MEKITLNKQDFKKYLLANLPDSRQEELIFWKKKIPLPIDLIYKIFDKRGALIKIYLDHISSFCLYSYASVIDNPNSVPELSNLPNSSNNSNFDILSTQYNNHYLNSKISDLTANLASRLFIVEYKFSEADYLKALCHEGRKYKRLYLPSEIKKCLKSYDSELIEHIGVSNGDMFGNIVADELGVYRSGFSDAFSAIFNKLLDFIFQYSDDNQISISTASQIKISQLNEPLPSYVIINKGLVVDGSLWEPKYVDAKPSYILNEKHPYLEFLNNKTGLEVLIDFASQSALIEGETIKDSTRKALEIYRQDISRLLRLISETSN
jgi:hypothetical protein